MALLSIPAFAAMIHDSTAAFNSKFNSLENGDLRIIEGEVTFEWASSLYSDILSMPLGEKPKGLLVGIAKRNQESLHWAPPFSRGPWIASSNGPAQAGSSFNGNDSWKNAPSVTPGEQHQSASSPPLAGANPASNPNEETYENLIENPEPATVGLFSIALIGMLLLRKHVLR